MATIKELSKMAFWSVLGQCMIPFFTVINTSIVGRKFDEDTLAAYGLGQLMVSLGVAPLIQATSMITCASQANGKRDYRLARILLHRQYVITAVGCLIFFFPLFFSESVLIALGQEKTTSALA